MKYEDTNLTFDAPDGWNDNSMVAFSAPKRADQKVTPNFVVTRESAPVEESLEDYANRQLVEMAKQLDGFRLHKRRLTQVSGLPGVEVSFSWGPGGTLRQRQIFVRSKHKTFSLVCTCLEAEATSLAKDFDATIASVRLS